MEWKAIEDILNEKEQEIVVYFKNTAGWHVTTAYWDGIRIIELCEKCGNREPWGYDAIISYWMKLPEPPSINFTKT